MLVAALRCTCSIWKICVSIWKICEHRISVLIRIHCIWVVLIENNWRFLAKNSDKQRLTIANRISDTNYRLWYLPKFLVCFSGASVNWWTRFCFNYCKSSLVIFENVWSRWLVGIFFNHLSFIVNEYRRVFFTHYFKGFPTQLHFRCFLYHQNQCRHQIERHHYCWYFLISLLFPLLILLFH